MSPGSTKVGAATLKGALLRPSHIVEEPVPLGMPESQASDRHIQFDHAIDGDESKRMAREVKEVGPNPQGQLHSLVLDRLCDPPQPRDQRRSQREAMEAHMGGQPLE